MNYIKTAVILSRPYGSVGTVPGFKFLSKNAFKHYVLFSFLRPSLNSSVSSEWPSPYFYQIPSQPTIIIYYYPVRSTYIISGMQVIGCWLKGKPYTFLWLKSPIDLVKLRPFTLPWTIGTPVFYILFLSTGFSGLWSKDSGMHLSFCQSAALESPAFAHITFF